MLHTLIDLFLHLDAHLTATAAQLGSWFYGLLFLIVFCETGLVVTPFLPGDSLLFAVGALAAVDGSPLSLPLLFGLLLVAAIGGDAVNYAIGAAVGPRVFTREDTWWLHQKHLVQAQQFYDRYGNKAIFLSRFVPIVRTFAPFVAGVGTMRYRRFAAWNVVGGFTWVAAFLFAGYHFGNIPSIKRNFHYVIVAIIVISVVPIVVEAWRARRSQGVG
jgi:membrane-associated protein